MTFIISLRAELLKIKRSSILYLILTAAIVVPFVLVFDFDTPTDNTPNVWNHYYFDGFKVFAFLFLPLFYILTSTLLMQIEFKSNTWKQVLASPQSYFHMLSAKFLILQLMALAFLIVFNIYMVIGCLLIDFIYDNTLTTSLLGSWPKLISLNLMALGSTIGISALSFWLALRSKNFVAPIAIGFLLWLIGPTAALELKWPHFDKYVFVLPFTIAVDRFEGSRFTYQMISLGYGILFFGIAYLEFVLQRLTFQSGIFKK